jgi:hypothetical protein
MASPTKQLPSLPEFHYSSAQFHEQSIALVLTLHVCIRLNFSNMTPSLRSPFVSEITCKVTWVSSHLYWSIIHTSTSGGSHTLSLPLCLLTPVTTGLQISLILEDNFRWLRRVSLFCPCFILPPPPPVVPNFTPFSYFPLSLYPYRSETKRLMGQTVLSQGEVGHTHVN